MPNWNETINITVLHRLYTSGGISLQQLSKSVIRKLRLTEAFASSEPDIIDIIMAFEAIDEMARLQDYHVALDLLYEFGDKDHRLWVEVENGSSQENDDIPARTKNPFEEDTKPQFGKLQAFKGPYLKNLNAIDWIKNPTTTPSAEKEKWDSAKTYRVGDRVTKDNQNFECIISCCNVDPVPNSYSKPGDSWKFIIPPVVDKHPSDPKLVFSDRLTCSPPANGKIYPPTRKYHYMSEEEFNKKLVGAQINPATMPRELYSYMKDCEEHYQEWLISRWHKQNLTFKELEL